MTVRSTLLLTGFLLLTGCSPGPGRITGHVTFKGAALPSGSVTFHAADGNAYGSALAPDGTFAVEGVPPGPARVTVTSHPHVPKGLLGKDRNKAAGVEAAKFVPIPERYGQADRSGLTCPVKGGAQTCDLPLEP